MTATVSQRQAAAMLGVTRPSVQHALRTGRLEDLTPESVERYRQARETAQDARDARRVSRPVQPQRPRSPRFSEVHAAELAEQGYVDAHDREGIKFPVEPLIRLCRRQIKSLSRSLGTEWANVYRALREGVTWSQADRWAVACGFHPAEVWGHAWFAAVEADD